MKKLLLVPLIFLLITCSKRVEQKYQEVTIKLSQKQEKKNPLLDDFEYTNPTSINDYDCLGLFVGYPEIQSQNICFDDNNNVIAEFNDWFGLAPVVISGNSLQSGGVLTANLLIGPARRFYVIGFNIDSTQISCPSILEDWDSVEQYMSEPDLLNPGGVSIDVTPGASAASINISYSNHTDFDDCDGPLFDLEGEGSGGIEQSGLVGWFKAGDINGNGNSGIGDNQSLTGQSWFNHAQGQPNITIVDATTDFAGSPFPQGNASIVLDGTADYMTLPASSFPTRSIIMAIKPDNFLDRTLFKSASSLWTDVQFTMAGPPDFYWQGDLTGSDLTAGTMILTMDTDGTSGNVKVNGITIAGSGVAITGNPNNPETLFHDNSASFFQGGVAEIIMYSDQDAVKNAEAECYLGNKYGITVNGC